MKTIYHTFWRWLPFAVIATILAGLMYVVGQQNLRQSANDPQIQLSEDAADILATGQPPQIFGSNGGMDFGKSLVPFIIVYDESGNVLSNTASLNGTVPRPPQGVFDYTKLNGEHRVTWEPQSGIRIAAVINHYAGSSTGYVLAGRSLREVDKRVDALMLYVFIGWIAALIASFLLMLFVPTARELESQSM